MTNENRVCRTCGEAKPATAEFFYVRSTAGFQRQCKVCFRAAKAARDAADPEHRRAVARKSYHKVDGAAVKRRARERRPELYQEIAQRYEVSHAEERHRDRVARHEANLDADRMASKDWYYDNRERAIETALAWIKAHPDEAKVQTEKTRALRRGAPGSVTAVEWAAKVREFEGRCAYCGQVADPVELEHFLPLSRGGHHVIGNVVPACRACNRSKGQKTFAEWQALRTRRGAPLPRHPNDVLADLHRDWLPPDGGSDSG